MKITYLGILVVVILGIVLGYFIIQGIECLFSTDDSPLVEQGFQLNVDGAVNKKMLAEFTASVKSLETSLNRLSERTWGGVERGEETEDGGERIPLNPDAIGRLEHKIELLASTIRSSALSSERNTSLQEYYSGLENKTPIPIGHNWRSNAEAKSELFLMTYSQILKRFGPPQLIYTGSGNVYWTYGNVYIIFTDGYVSKVELD